jgi:hypothetical protein
MVLAPLPSPRQTRQPPLPSGLVVAYIKSGNLWLWREGVARVQLTFSGVDSDPRLSPDGQVIVFRRGEELWAVNAVGGGERQLISNAFLASLVGPGVEAVRIGPMAWNPTQPHSLLPLPMILPPRSVIPCPASISS